MSKKNIEMLIIEVTRRCNMECEHCLRGEFDYMDADLNLIPEIFGDIESIGCLTFSGGEPSLNPGFITACVDYIEEHNITVAGVFIATNGLIYCQELVDAVRRLWTRYYTGTLCSMYNGVYYNGGMTDFCNRNGDISVKSVENIINGESYMFSITISMDRFHKSVPIENYLRYYTCGFYSDSNTYDMDDSSIIPRGRGADVSDGSRSGQIQMPYFDDYGNPEQIYVSCNGMVFSDCDLSYEMMNDDNAIGTIVPGQESLGNILFKAWQEELKG